jgi:hypothetical protein
MNNNKIFCDNFSILPKPPAGDFTYPFSFLLSEEIPSSFKGRHGSVRYACAAFIDRLWKDGKVVTEDFVVVHQLDCNHLVHAMDIIILATL